MMQLVIFVYLTDFLSSPKATGKGVLRNRCSRGVLGSSLNVNNKINTNPVDIANCFNDYFSNIGSKLAEKIFPSKYDHLHYLKCSNPVSIFIKPTSTIEILNLISTLNNNKSSGPFSIPTDIFKMTGNIMASPLTEIINLSFSTGIYPNNLKIAKIIPVFKNKGSNLQCNN